MQVSETVGFIGLGAMGRPMALNLRKHGIAVIAHNRSQAAERALRRARSRVRRRWWRCRIRIYTMLTA